MLVEPNAHPILNHCNATFAAAVARARNLRPLYVLDSGNAATRALLRSYAPHAEFVSMETPRYFAFLALAVFRAWRTYRRLEKPGDILELSVDGIRFGDMVYDDILTGGYATVDRVDRRTLRSLVAFYWYHGVIRDIMRCYQVKTAIFSHTIGISSGSFARTLLRGNVEVMTRLGSHQTVIKKSHQLADLGVFPLHPEPQYFDWMLAQYEEHVETPAMTYLEARFNQDVNQVAVDLAFNRQKRRYGSANEFCREMGLDPGLPTVFVMLHAFNDFPHSHFARPMLFQDYYVWFQRTLQIARRVSGVNWVFKEHPAAVYYVTRDLDLDAVFAAERDPHIDFLGRDADFNAASVAVIASAVVTCQGTAGMEYSCLGIPSVLAGESPYSGLGFSVEPQTIAEYEQQLKQIATLPRLTAAQVRRARAALYFELYMLQQAPFLFCPFYTLPEIREMTPERFWTEAAAHLRAADRAQLEQQVATLGDFACRENYTQFIDLERFGFMRPVVDGAPD